MWTPPAPTALCDSNLWSTLACALLEETKPPVGFEGTLARCFPIAARASTLQQFVDDYLNRPLAGHVACFRVVVPCVFLTVVHYGKMMPNNVAGREWAAQSEMFFLVPVAVYEAHHGRMRFKKIAAIVPYILVDDFVSATNGRLVFGWQKTFASFVEPGRSWERSPLEARPLLDVFLPSSSQALEDLPRRRVVRIEENATDMGPSFPPSFSAEAAGASLFWRRLAELPGELLGMGSCVANMWQADHRPSWAQLLATLRQFQVGAGPGFDIVNLKQVWSAEAKERAIYQALVASNLRVQRVGGVGLLKNVTREHLTGSGGYKIHITRFESLPITQKLGLRIDTTVRDRGFDCTTDSFTPMAPTWMRFSMVNPSASRICWRYGSSAWRRGDGQEVASGECPSPTKQGPEAVELPKYVATLGRVSDLDPIARALEGERPLRAIRMCFAAERDKLVAALKSPPEPAGAPVVFRLSGRTPPQIVVDLIFDAPASIPARGVYAKVGWLRFLIPCEMSVAGGAFNPILVDTYSFGTSFEIVEKARMQYGGFPQFCSIKLYPAVLAAGTTTAPTGPIFSLSTDLIDEQTEEVKRASLLHFHCIKPGGPGPVMHPRGRPVAKMNHGFNVLLFKSIPSVMRDGFDMATIVQQGRVAPTPAQEPCVQWSKTPLGVRMKVTENRALPIVSTLGLTATLREEGPERRSVCSATSAAYARLDQHLVKIQTLCQWSPITQRWHLTRNPDPSVHGLRT